MKLHPLTTDGTSEGSVVVRLLPLCFAVFIFYCAPLFSQGNLGQILGTVTDQSGGVVTGATVIILDTQRGVSRTLTTNESGEYNAPNLIPGTYTVRAAFRGFKTVERSGILIEVGQEARVDLSLQPGEQSEKVTVTEVLPLIETTNATLGGTLSNESAPCRCPESGWERYIPRIRLSSTWGSSPAPTISMARLTPSGAIRHWTRVISLILPLNQNRP
ncbi:MAG: hypothetical protein DMG32_22665 [Acidobacteria bacterium]|nr:MAG: hypothetical protein DMG32_22665 [Acidobacteriota bacterium]